MSTKVLEKANIPKLERWEHIEDSDLGIPYYDEELDLPHLKPHRIAISYICDTFDLVAKKLGLEFLSDQPIWYIEPNTKEQKNYYPDAGLSTYLDAKRIIATDLLLALEVVSTQRKDKEMKDTKRMKYINGFNGIPEFVLVYPDLDDNRVLEWYSFQGNEYNPVIPNEKGFFCSSTVPGLSMRIMPKDDWVEGMKIEILFQERPLIDYKEVVEKLEKTELKLERTKLKLEREIKQSEQNKKLLELYAKKLQELGIDPSQLEQGK